MTDKQPDFFAKRLKKFHHAVKRFVTAPLGDFYNSYADPFYEDRATPPNSIEEDDMKAREKAPDFAWDEFEDAAKGKWRTPRPERPLPIVLDSPEEEALRLFKIMRHDTHPMGAMMPVLKAAQWSRLWDDLTDAIASSGMSSAKILAKLDPAFTDLGQEEAKMQIADWWLKGAHIHMYKAMKAAQMAAPYSLSRQGHCQDLRALWKSCLDKEEIYPQYFGQFLHEEGSSFSRRFFGRLWGRASPFMLEAAIRFFEKTSCKTR